MKVGSIELRYNKEREEKEDLARARRKEDAIPKQQQTLNVFTGYIYVI